MSVNFVSLTVLMYKSISKNDCIPGRSNTVTKIRFEDKNYLYACVNYVRGLYFL